MHPIACLLFPAFLYILLVAPKQVLAEPVAESDEIFEKLEDLNVLRETLAASLANRSAPIDEATFAHTCMPIGKELKRWAQEYGYQAKQISHKNRNPKNSVPEQDRDVYALFLKNQGKNTHTSIHPSKSSTRSYYARIPYVASCGHCHGSKESRPDFVIHKYPTDAAYGFEEGDLRGLYVIRNIGKKE